ncbi:M23 family metallopeptidase [Rhodoferax aquaticus]|uniref:M23 family metallopeptidase n=1 Tax=Rhodoferax aquaticus TaxID=2527691 RepID=UPI003CC95927
MIDGFTQAAAQLWAYSAYLAKRYPKRIVSAIGVSLLVGAGGSYAVSQLVPDPADMPVRTVVENLTLPPVSAATEDVTNLAMRLYRSDLTRSTDTADVLLKRLGVFDTKAAEFLRNDKLMQQLVLGRAGRNITAETTDANGLLRLTARWSPEDDGMFKRLSIEKLPEGFVSRLETLPMAASSRLASGTIASSLFAATDDASIPDAVAIQLAEIFSGDIDFHRALRKGDRFSVVYESLEGDGEPLRAGRVLSAEFVNNGKTHQAMWFQEPAAVGTVTDSAATHNLTKGGYFTLAGDSLRKTFLASPMEFSRVSSGFKMRFHPILQTWRAHLGVDYAAATGTPVRTVADGIVEFAGVQNGFGNVVFVKHANNTTTVYAHLSRIDVQRGQSVSQAQHIGAVGATGWATGPHLHFEFRVNGVHQDPLLAVGNNVAVPISASVRPLFDKAAASVRHQLEAALYMQTASAE